MRTLSINIRRACARLVLPWLMIWVALGTLAGAQEKPPFIEPSEHVHAKARVLEETQPNQHGKWETLDTEMPINPVHVALMHTGKVLVIAGSGNDDKNKRFDAGVWDPQSQTIRTFVLGWDMFCNGMVILPDGRPFVLGGTLKYDSPWIGEPRTAAFDPATEKFIDLAKMSGGRWYPTGTVLGDGSIMVDSGLDVGSLNHTVQIYKGTTWSAAGSSFPGMPLYPRQTLLPNGTVFESGANPDSRIYDPAKRQWSDPVATTKFGNSRDYGTSVLLPLTPANNYKPRVMILGGGFNLGDPVNQLVTNTTEIIDLSAAAPQWQFGPVMSGPRVQLNATILPDGKVLVSGGSAKDENGGTANRQAELYQPNTNNFSPAGTMEFPRLYHSNTLLLPDATVLAVGGNPARGDYEAHIEIYSPPYLFDNNGNPARRPAISQAPAAIQYGASFAVRSAEAADIDSVVLIRPGAVTHAFDMEQRLVGLSYTKAAGVLNVKAPSGGNIAPPGYYLLFIVNSAGVPSLAKFVYLK